MTEVEEQVKFKFSELSESAKVKARDEYRSGNYPSYEWWDNTYEDAVRMGALMGIKISSTRRASARKGHPGYNTIDIFFSGFCCQGDGASFEGTYDYVPDAIFKVEQETSDEELLRITRALHMLQLTRRLQGLSNLSAKITTTGGYNHSGTMDVSVQMEEDILGAFEYEDRENAVTQLMRDFADLIYKWLEQEHDYLTSDECIDQSLDGEIFDEFGSVI